MVMDIFKNLTIEKSKTVNYLAKSKEFFISEIGVHDFQYVSPLTAPRVQPYFTLHYVISGSGFLEFQGKKYHIRENEYFIYPPNECLSYYPDPEEPWMYFWFNFEGPLAERYYKELYIDSPVLNQLSKEENYRLLSNFLLTLSMEQPKYYVTLSLFYSILGKLTKTKEQYLPKNSFCQTAKRIINLNYTQPSFSIENLCTMLHVSHSYLCKIFKEGTNTTLKNYLTLLRLNHSLLLLKTTTNSIKQVAYDSGFYDEFNFMKAFKKHFGYTPSDYREKHSQ